jgi:hypothetical protein
MGFLALRAEAAGGVDAIAQEDQAERDPRQLGAGVDVDVWRERRRLIERAHAHEGKRQNAAVVAPHCCSAGRAAVNVMVHIPNQSLRAISEAVNHARLARTRSFWVSLFNLILSSELTSGSSALFRTRVSRRLWFMRGWRRRRHTTNHFVAAAGCLFF